MNNDKIKPEVLSVNMSSQLYVMNLQVPRNKVNTGNV